MPPHAAHTSSEHSPVAILYKDLYIKGLMAYPVASKSLNPNSSHVWAWKWIVPKEPLLTPALGDAWIVDSTESELGYR